MKKMIALFMVAMMCLSLVACGGNDEPTKANEKVELTTSNIEDYLKISAKVEECNFDEGMLGYLGAEGNAAILIETINISGAKFKDVTITCEVWVAGGLRCGWEFTKDNVRCEEEHKQEYNYKEITIDLSYDGEETVNENVEWANYKGQWSDSGVVYDELSDSDIEIKIIKVTGTVTVDD